MKAILKMAAAMSVVAIQAACVDAPQTTYSPVNENGSVGAKDFVKLGLAAGKACADRLTGTGNPEKLLKDAGFSRGESLGKVQFYQISVPGGRKTILGTETGKANVSLPLTKALSDKMTCRARLEGFGYGEGNMFYRAFILAGRSSSAGDDLRITGHFAHGEAKMLMRY